MKRILVVGALILGLVACGRDTAGGSTDGSGGSGGTGGSGGSTGGTSYPYNPDASSTEASDTRIPYRGDWVWAAKLSDGSYKLGVLVISGRGEATQSAKNGGTGQNAPCADANCTSINTADYSYGLIYTQVPTAGAPQLTVLLGDPASTTNSRLAMVDTDGKVTTNAEGNAVVSGAGKWAGTQDARVALVQINSDENVGGRIDATVSATLLAQVKAAADGVAAQRVQALPSLDGKSMLK